MDRCVGGGCLVAAQRPEQQRLQSASGRSAGRRQGAPVDVLDGEAAPQHLDEHLPELPGGQIVKEGVDNGAQVEEGVGHQVERGDSVQVGGGPVGLGNSGHHET